MAVFSTYIKYSATLIALYLLVANASGTGVLLSQGAAGLATVNKSLQGR